MFQTTEIEIEILDKINEYKAKLAERSKINYYKRKSEGRLKAKAIPKELHKKRGPKTQLKENEIEEPKQKGRKPVLFKIGETIPQYLLLTLQDKE
jgi:hypothetical protein